MSDASTGLLRRAQTNTHSIPRRPDQCDGLPLIGGIAELGCGCGRGDSVQSPQLAFTRTQKEGRMQAGWHGHANA